MLHTFNAHISVTILEDFQIGIQPNKTTVWYLGVQLFLVNELWFTHFKCKGFCERHAFSYIMCLEHNYILASIWMN